MTETTPVLLAGSPPHFRVFHYDRLESTNSEALALLDEAEKEANIRSLHRSVVWASRQSAGRGRLGRRWESCEGNLFCSVILCPDCDLAEASELSFVAALALSDSIKLLSGQTLQGRLKWPNDVLIQQKKVAGILLESRASLQSGAMDAIVMGVGLNTMASPSDVSYPTTSLFEASEQKLKLTSDQVLPVFLTALEQWYRCWTEIGFPAIRESWMGRSEVMGRPLRVVRGNRVLKGVFSGLSADGALRLRLEDGEEVSITAGDVFFDE